MGSSSKPDYLLVDIVSLQPGLFLDRTLYLFMESSQRFIPYVHPLSFLDETLVNKLRKFKKVYSDVESIETRMEEFPRMVSKVRRVLDDQTMASFEKNHQIVDAIQPLLDLIFTAQESSANGIDFQNRLLPIFLMVKVLRSPKLEQLRKLSDQDLRQFDDAIRIGALTTFYTMLFGYYDLDFLCRLFESFFVIAFQTPEVVGVKTTENRFYHLAAGDEIFEIEQLAKWSLGLDVSALGVGRLKRKLSVVLKKDCLKLARGFLKVTKEESESSQNSNEGVAA